jgi:hypothetical protein
MPKLRDTFRGKTQRQVQISPRPFWCILSFIFQHTLDVPESKSGRVFCEELSTLVRRAGSPAGIIQAVTAVEGDKSANKTGPWLRRIVLRSLVAGVGLLGIAYAADYGVFRYRLATKRQPFGSVTVEHYYEVAHKDGKAELIFDPPVQKTCVHSLFPHSGDPPCWFLIRHADQRTDI